MKQPTVKVTIEEYEHGILFLGNSMPVDYFSPAMLKIVARGRSTKKMVLSMGLPNALGFIRQSKVLFCCAWDATSADKWENEVESYLAKDMADSAPIVRWYRGIDTGISSRTIASIAHPYMLHEGNSSPPKDASDFGRCHRLVRLCPELRERIPDVAAKYGGPWVGIAEQWDPLSALATAAGLDSRRGPFVEEKMRELTTAISAMGAWK